MSMFLLTQNQRESSLFYLWSCWVHCFTYFSGFNSVFSLPHEDNPILSWHTNNIQPLGLEMFWNIIWLLANQKIYTRVTPVSLPGGAAEMQNAALPQNSWNWNCSLQALHVTSMPMKFCFLLLIVGRLTVMVFDIWLSLASAVQFWCLKKGQTIPDSWTQGRQRRLGKGDFPFPLSLGSWVTLGKSFQLSSFPSCYWWPSDPDYDNGLLMTGLSMNKQEQFT